MHAESGRAVPLLGTMIDSGGHHTQAVYAYARANQHERVMATKGMSQPQAHHRQALGRRCELPRPADQARREAVADRPGHGEGGVLRALRVPEPGPGFVLLSKAMPAEAFEQLTSERLVTRST
jgi:phage terminase large subunit GpA-like protein